MRFILTLLLIVLFVYSLALVLLNGTPVSVDLWFNHVPEMRVGLLVLITLALGILVGLLLGVQVFRVFQNHWEISRLQKEIDRLRKEQIQQAQSAAAEAAANVRHEKTIMDISPEDKSPL
ncbi:lipopolysaccharide assembly protein LapA domain-containing protein [Acinetobacter sp.]|uniref:lipopolysaccharide assembly protein LapA domain-containing protein n=1 Tax=Acinetobacter sp. TaxID=472 RepID=UPI0031D55568